MKNLPEKIQERILRMNKLMVFFELQDMSLPSIPWREYTGREYLRDDLLWTVRSAVFHGDDLNLPRLVGANSKDAKESADHLLEEFVEHGNIVRPGCDNTI